VPVQLLVERFVHDAHAARAEPLENPVAGNRPTDHRFVLKAIGILRRQGLRVRSGRLPAYKWSVDFYESGYVR
jgi:hypothetical protein